MIEPKTNTNRMIRHIVMWKFRRDLEQNPLDVAREMKERLESLRGKIDGLNSIEVGINCRESKSSYDAVLTADFASWEALDSYKTSPLHVPISEYCKSCREARVDIDYEI